MSSTHRYTALRLLIPLLAGIVVLACLETAAHIEHAADITRQNQAAQDAQREADAVQNWVEVHRDALYGMAAVFSGSAPLTTSRYAAAARTLAPLGGEVLLPPVAFVGPDHRIRFSTEQEGDLAPGHLVSHIAALEPLMRQLADAPAGQMTIGPLFRNHRDGWSAYLALVTQQREQPGVLFTVVDFVNLGMAHATVTPGLDLRLALQTAGRSVQFVSGKPEPGKDVLFTIEQATGLHGAVWELYWDVLPAYPGNQAWRQAQLLALVLRAGGIVLALGVGLSLWILLGLLQRGTRRERDLAQAHTQLAQSEHHYRSLIDQVPGAVFRCDIDEARTMRYLSPAIEPLCGCTPASLIGNREHRYADLIHPADRPRVTHTIKHALVSEELYEVEYRLLQRDGIAARWVFERGIATHAPHHMRQIDGVIIDIDARRIAETRTQQTTQALRTIIENAPNVAIQGYDASGHILFWNKASEAMFGWREVDVMGSQVAELGLNAEPLINDLAEIQRTGLPRPPTETLMQRRDGGQVACLSTLFAIGKLDERDAFIRMDVDITSRKQVEDELREARDRLEENVAERTAELQTANEELTHAMAQLVQSEKLASLGSLVAGIAHELNTPLGNAVTVASTLAQKVLEFDDVLSAGQLRKSELMNFVQSCGEAAALIERNAQRAAELISNFKQVAVDTASTRRRSFNLRRTVEEVLSTLRPQLKHTPHQIILDMPDTLNLESYPGPLEQILTNLVTNSVAHAFTHTAAGEIRISAQPGAQGLIELVFEDNGSGIPPSLRKRVFDPFFTTRLGQGGSGLGLYIVYSLVHGVLGGRLTLATAASGGARFEIELPCVAPHPHSTEASAHAL